MRPTAARQAERCPPHKQWLGEISYAFYLVHFLVLSVGLYLLGDRKLSSPAAFGLLAVLFGVATLLAWLLHTLVERPMMKHFSRSRRSREESAPVALRARRPARTSRPPYPARSRLVLQP